MQIPQEKLFDAVVKITAGLLSSGHFTIPPDMEEPQPLIIREDNGKEWQKERYARKYSAVAINHAMSLVEEIRDEFDILFNPKAE